MILASSPVVFNKELHTYTAPDGRSLRGITGLIHGRLFPNDYRGVDPEVMRSAAAYGSAVHQMCEDYDTEGVISDNKDVEAYICCCEFHNLLHQASEYLVSDNEKYATCIDKVYIVDEHTVDLVDIKTTNTLNRDYVSWQLSVCAYLFERQNPDIKVRNLYGMHLRNGEFKLVPVARKVDEAIEGLLYMDAYGSAYPMPEKYNEENIVQIAILAKYYADRLEEMKAEMLADMERDNSSRWERGRVQIIRREGGTRTRFDAKRFEAEHADMYAEYVTESVTKSSITIKIKEQ